MKTRYPLLLSVIFFLSLLSSVTPTSQVAGYAPIIHLPLSPVDALSLTDDGVYMENGGPFDVDPQASGLLLSGTTTRVSVASDGTEGNHMSIESSISADGRYVAFDSASTNLVPNDTNDRGDVFVYDRQTGETSRASVTSAGLQGNSSSLWPSISADGRYVAFVSGANNLVPGDTNGGRDIFVHDRQTGQTSRVSVASDGTQAIANSFKPSISANGRYVAFYSEANNLVPGDTNDWLDGDIFVHDRQTGETSRVSVASDGTQTNYWSTNPSISADGRYVAFVSGANNLVPNDTNNESDTFVHDRQTAETSRVSLASDGTEGNSNSGRPSILGNGRYVAFDSWATNLVPNDTNGVGDIFVHDRQTGETSRVSLASDGTEATGGSNYVSISADGRYVVFWSEADNLVPNDTNGVGDVFVHDRQTGETSLVSVASDGTQSNSGFSDGETLSISANGRNVAFSSRASNLVPGDTNGWEDIFVHARDGAVNFYLPLTLR